MINQKKKSDLKKLTLDFSKIIFAIVSELEKVPNKINKIIFKKLRNDLDKLMESKIRPEEENIIWVHVNLGVIGSFDFPAMQMGKGNTLDLFTLEDLVLFSYYWINRSVSGIFVDIGANIGLHSAVALQCGLTVVAFEPSPLTYSIGKQFLGRISNNIKFVDPLQAKANLTYNHSCYVEAAVSNFDGNAEFIQLNENPFGNHLSGKKKSVYGSTNSYNVTIVSLSHLSKTNSLIKLDAEGADADIFGALLDVRDNAAKSTVFLCDWRDETRLDIYNLLVKHDLSLISSIDEIQFDSFDSFPKNHTFDFGIVNI